MKRFLALFLAAALSLSACFPAFAEEETAEPAAPFGIWDSDGESMKWLASAVLVAENVVATSAALLPDSPDHIVVTQGKKAWEAKAVVPDESGLVAMVFLDMKDSPADGASLPLLPWGASVSASSCVVRFGDEQGRTVERGILDAESIRVGSRRCILLTLEDEAPLGSALVAADSCLAGVVAAEWAEGVHRVLALPAEELVADMSAAASLLTNVPEWGNAPSGMHVSLDKNTVTLDWTEMELPEKAEGEELYLILLDTGNNYLNYYSADMENRRASLALTPGRCYLAGIAASKDAPDEIPSSYVFFQIPAAKKLTDHNFKQVLTAIAEEPERGLRQGEEPTPVPASEVTEALLRSGRAYFYSHSTYEVTRTIADLSLLVTLTDPDGVNYRYNSTWFYMPDYNKGDIWFVPLKDMGLTESLDRKGYPKGVYRLAVYVDGDLADAIEFELK